MILPQKLILTVILATFGALSAFDAWMLDEALELFRAVIKNELLRPVKMLSRIGSIIGPAGFTIAGLLVVWQ